MPAMLTSQDYRQMADRSAQLAIACTAPDLAKALMALALDYMTLAARPAQPGAGKQPRPQMLQDPSLGFGD
jgi:hypothetical protein